MGRRRLTAFGCRPSGPGLGAPPWRPKARGNGGTDWCSAGGLSRVYFSSATIHICCERRSRPPWGAIVS